MNYNSKGAKDAKEIKNFQIFKPSRSWRLREHNISVYCYFSTTIRSILLSGSAAPHRS